MVQIGAGAKAKGNYGRMKSRERGEANDEGEVEQHELLVLYVVDAAARVGSVLARQIAPLLAKRGVRVSVSL
jgi:hypothetical protein